MKKRVSLSNHCFYVKKYYWIPTLLYQNNFYLSIPRSADSRTHYNKNLCYWKICYNLSLFLRLIFIFKYLLIFCCF